MLISKRNLSIKCTEDEKVQFKIYQEERDIINEYLQKKEQITYKTVQYNEGELYFILPDAHYPFENKVLMDKIFNCIGKNKVAGVCISGDWLDLFTLGSYNADSLELLKNITLTEEYVAGLQGIKDLESVLSKNAKRSYLFGNHEDRFFREIMKRDNGKYGNTLQNPVDALELVKYNYDVKTNWKDDFFTIGDIDITHGVYTNIHSAHKHLQMHGRSIIFGHTHRIQTYYTSHEASFNIGCLCDIHNKAFNYMPRMQKEIWSNGFAVVNVIDGKSFVEVITVRNNGFIFRGKKY